MSLIAELFTDLFAGRDNLLTRLDARVKLLVVLMTLIAITMSTQPLLPLVAFAACLTTSAWIGIPWRYMGLRMLAPMIVATVLVILQSLLYGSTPLVSTHLFGWHVVITREGWHSGLLMAARVLGGVSVIFLLGNVTPAHMIFRALRSLGIPHNAVEMVMLTYRYVFVLLDLSAEITCAQRLRLGYSHIRSSLTCIGNAAGMVIIHAIDQASRSHEAMQLRGYTGEFPLGSMPPLRRRDFTTVALSFLTIGTILTLIETSAK